MQRRTFRTLLGTAAAATAALMAGAAIAGCGSTAHPDGGGSSSAVPAQAGSQYDYYRSMMGRYQGGGMMGGGPGGWMMGRSGYQRMTGAGGVPGWMHGGRLPGYMMGTSTDPGKVMGRFWASAPGPRVSAGQAARLGSQLPAGAHVNRSARTITFTTGTVRLNVVASPQDGPDETFRIVGMVNPRLVIPAGATVRSSWPTPTPTPRTDWP